MSRRRSSFRSFLACGGIAVVAACSGGDAQLDFDPAATPTVPSPTSVPGEQHPPLPRRPASPPSTRRRPRRARSRSALIRRGRSTGGCSAPTCRPGSDRTDSPIRPSWRRPRRSARRCCASPAGAGATATTGSPASAASNRTASRRGRARPSDFVALMEATGLPGVWTASFSGTAEEAAAAVAFFNGDVDDDRVIGVDEEGRDWQTVGEWARLRAAGGHPDPARIELWEVGNEVYGAKPAAGPDCASVRVGGRVDVRRHPVRRRRRRARRVPRVPRRDARRRPRHRSRGGWPARRRELGQLGRRSDRRCRRPARLLRHPQLRLRGRAGRLRRTGDPRRDLAGSDATGDRDARRRRTRRAPSRSPSPSTTWSPSRTPTTSA